MSSEIEDDDLLPEDVADGLASRLRPQWPAPDRAARLRARVLAAVASDARDATSGADIIVDSGRETIAVPARQWEECWSGIEICVLRENADGRTYLLRMHPGSVLPAHTHTHDEESLMIEGEAWTGEDEHLVAGDYQFLPAGSQHSDIRSPGGCIVFVRSDPRFRPKLTRRFVGRFIRYTVRRWMRGADNGSSGRPVGIRGGSNPPT